MADGPTTDNQPRPAKTKGRSTGLIKTLADRICAADRFTQDAGGRLYRYAGGNYKRRGDEHIRRRVKQLCLALRETNEWSSHLASEVVEYVRVDSPELWERPLDNVVNVENGLLRITDGALLPHTPDHLSSIQLPVKYDPAASCPNIERFVAEVFPADARDLAWELPGVLMIPVTWTQKAVLLLGEGANGKSVYLALQVRFLGRENVASIPLHKLEENQFASARLVGRLANICADLPSSHLAATTIFKWLTGEDLMDSEKKFQEGTDIRPFARLVFSANHPPRSADSSGAFFRRWLVLPFDRTFSPNEQIPRHILDAQLQSPDELSGMLNRALEGLRRVQSQKGFSQPESVQAAFQEFHATTDPLAIWLDHNAVDSPELFCPISALRAAYNASAEREGRPPLSPKAFGMAIARNRPRIVRKQRMFGGRLQWVYLGIGLASMPPLDSHDSQRYPFMSEVHARAHRNETETNRENGVNDVNYVTPGEQNG